MKTASASAATLLLALASQLPVAAPAQAAESYDACTGTISALPAVVNTPGTWCLTQNLSTSMSSGTAITLDGNDIVLDCNGFKIDGSGAGAGTLTKGIRATNRTNVTVRNCAVRGFQYGIAMLGATGAHHLVEHNRASGNTFSGLWVEGDGSLVRDNQVTLTGGSTANPHAYGIYSRYVVDIADNTVSGVAGTAGQNGNVIGIYTYGNVGGTVSGNRIHGLVKTGTLPVRGIYNYSSSRVVLSRNNLTGDATTGSVGMTCTNSTSRAKDNVIGGFVTGLSACGDAGRNDITP
jgi:hypothetical protein